MCVWKKVIRSLTPKFDYFVCDIKQSKDLDSMEVKQLEGSLLSHEEKVKMRKKSNQNNLLLLMHPSKYLKVRKVTKEMHNGDAVEED